MSPTTISTKKSAHGVELGLSLSPTSDYIQVRNSDLSEAETEAVGSFELASINHRQKQDGMTALEVSFCDTLVEVKDLGKDWLKYGEGLVMEEWGEEGKNIWRQQLLHKRSMAGWSRAAHAQTVDVPRQGAQVAAWIPNSMAVTSALELPEGTQEKAGYDKGSRHA
ncbi:hypothetical protein PG991_014952 [Apiospora marii]|uniref:Uncharacterized protein n=1 Tax=Apiospora marii TaxID=335849 RepID=A0ABR1R3P5_9PEZI